MKKTFCKVLTTAVVLQATHGWSYKYSDGTYAYGWKKIDGNWYHFSTYSGYMFTGWQTFSNGNRYYFGDDGVMRTGQQTIDGKSYEFDNDGALQSRES